MCLSCPSLCATYAGSYRSRAIGQGLCGVGVGVGRGRFPSETGTNYFSLGYVFHRIVVCIVFCRHVSCLAIKYIQDTYSRAIHLMIRSRYMRRERLSSEYIAIH